MKNVYIASALVVGLTSHYAYSGEVNTSNITAFTSGSVISSSEVNTAVNEVVTQINDNNTNIIGLTEKVSSSLLVQSALRRFTEAAIANNTYYLVIDDGIEVVATRYDFGTDNSVTATEIFNSDFRLSDVESYTYILQGGRLSIEGDATEYYEVDCGNSGFLQANFYSANVFDSYALMFTSESVALSYAQGLPNPTADNDIEDLCTGSTP